MACASVIHSLGKVAFILSVTLPVLYNGGSPVGIGLVTVLLTIGTLQDFDITDVDDWKILAMSLLIPGSITFLLIKLGDFLGEHHIFELIELFKNIF